MHLSKLAPSRVAVGIVCAGSATLSATYYATWAPDLATMVGLAVFAFALDLTKPLMFRAATEAARDSRWGAVIGGGAIACLLAVVSMIAVDGMLLKLRKDTSGGREHVMGAHDRAAAAFRKAEAELAAIGQVVPVASLEAQLENAVPVNVWRRTAKCADVTQAGSREACEPALRIREQIAMSRRHTELESELRMARKVLDGSQRPAAADPQIEVLSHATGWDAAKILLALTWLAGGAMELVSCFGMALLSSGRTEQGEQPELVGLTPEQLALHWALEEISRQGGKLRWLNAAMATRFGVDPATVTRWRSRWRDAGLIDETRDGNVITLRVARGR